MLNVFICDGMVNRRLLIEKQFVFCDKAVFD